VSDVPPDDMNELPTWPEVVDACHELSLDEPFDVYRLDQDWKAYPAGSLIVLARDRFYVQGKPESGYLIKARGDVPEPVYVAPSFVNCKRCPLHEGRITIVDGLGPRQPKLMIVGEAPGREEDASGIPFVGASGTLLRATLAELGLKPDDVYLTNSVRCRPPENRNPTGKELEVCLHWLVQELQHVQPEAVLAVGVVAAGQVQAAMAQGSNGFRYFQAYHPAYILRQKGKRREWVKQLQEASRYVLGQPEPKIKPEPEPWIEAPISWDAPVIAIDTETVDLEDKYGQTVITIQASDGRCAELYKPVSTLAGRTGPIRVSRAQVPGEAGKGAQAGVLPEVEPVANGRRKPPVSSKELPELAACDRRNAAREPGEVPGIRWEDQSYRLDPGSRHFAYANVKHDLPRIGGDLRKLSTWDDVCLMAYVLRYPEVGLKKIGPELTGIAMAPITSVIGTGKNRIGFDEALVRTPEKAREYALLDAVVTARCYPILREQLYREPRLAQYYQTIEKPVVPIVYEMEQRGALIDNRALANLEGELAELRDGERDVAIFYAGQDINPNSSRDIAKVLQSLGAVLRDRTPTGAWQVDKAALLKVTGCADVPELDDRKPLDKFVKSVLAYREYAKLLGTYCKALKVQDEQGRVHTNYNQMVTATTRFSSSDPNLQNIPIRTPLGRRFRLVFIARSGYVIVKADFSQLELRIYAHCTQEPFLLDAYRHTDHDTSGIDNTCSKCDVHLRFATLWQRPRKIAKNGVFAVVYQVGDKTLAKTLGLRREETAGFLAKMKEDMPSVAGGWKDYISHTLASQGYVETLYGWRGYYPLYASPVPYEAAEALRQAANLPIQGTAGGILKQLFLAHDSLAPDYGQELLLQVHDEVVFEVPERNAVPFGHFLAGLADEINPLSVPLKLDVSIGPSWGETIPLGEYQNAR
jgi:uracil-DNA glycosylase family 4